MMFNKDTCSSTRNAPILYASIGERRRALLLLSLPTWMRIKRLFSEVHRKRIRGNRINWQQEKFSLDIRNFHYESELKLKLELEQEQEEVAQKGCGTSILGDVQNLTDKALTIVS